jgi:hypothetical protein
LICVLPKHHNFEKFVYAVTGAFNLAILTFFLDVVLVDVLLDMLFLVEIYQSRGSFKVQNIMNAWILGGIFLLVKCLGWLDLLFDEVGHLQ